MDVEPGEPLVTDRKDESDHEDYQHPVVSSTLTVNPPVWKSLEPKSVDVCDDDRETLDSAPNVLETPTVPEDTGPSDLGSAATEETSLGYSGNSYSTPVGTSEVSPEETSLGYSGNSISENRNIFNNSMVKQGANCWPDQPRLGPQGSHLTGLGGRSESKKRTPLSQGEPTKHVQYRDNRSPNHDRLVIKL